MELVASAIQMESTDEVKKNFSEALRLLKTAANDQCANLIVFPENFLCFGQAQLHYLASNLPLFLSKFQFFQISF